MFANDRLEAVRRRIASACARVGRRPEEVTLIGVTKTVPPEAVIAAYQSGLVAFGENRVQEAAEKIAVVRRAGVQAQWHLVGHLQTNKAKRALELFEMIQSVDTPHLAEALQRHAAALGRVVQVLVQINTSGETTKFGTTPAEARALVQVIAGFPNLRVLGLMTIGALDADTNVVRRCFRTLRELAAEISALNLPNVTMRHLSMGMTDDFEVALEEGATMIRVGRALFGDRA